MRSAGAIEAVFADAQLVDMTGTGLLDRIAGLVPAAARVLLVPEEDGGEHAAAPPSALVTDVWTAPTGGAALLARFERERRTLRRLHALQAQLDELSGAVEALRARYLEARRARDLLVDSVGARTDGGSRWWQDYRQLTALRETGCPLHRRALKAEALEGELLRVGVDLVPGALGRDFAVQADPALLREILERLGAGLERHGQRGARAHAHCRCEGDRVLLELSAPLGRHCDAAGLLDPLAALEGGPIEGAPLDLPIAEALAEVHGTALRLSVLGGELRARLALRRCEEAARAPARRGSPVVRALGRTL
ncbi:MAG: hypothetical protein V2J24_18335 [Pseudomonadales bacterium]|jgi:hypothetical protein|nr:hypothetical protein [Pseudomonadales bacterium]